MMAGNRVGKTESAGGYETTLHLTGRYPDWWPGFRFPRAISAWVAGKTSETVRDILTVVLLGPPSDRGTGLIPHADIADIKPRHGIPDSVDTAVIRHVSGGVSTLGFKSYDQGRQSFEGTKKDLILCDEEPPFAIYGEMLTRTMSTVPGRRGGMIMATFTPLLGLSETALYFMPHLSGAKDDV